MANDGGIQANDGGIQANDGGIQANDGGIQANDVTHLAVPLAATTWAKFTSQRLRSKRFSADQTKQRRNGVESYIESTTETAGLHPLTLDVSPVVRPADREWHP